MEILTTQKTIIDVKITENPVKIAVATQVILGKGGNNPWIERALEMGYEPFTLRPEYYLAYVSAQSLDLTFIAIHGIKALEENNWTERISPLRRRVEPHFSTEAQMKYDEAQKSKVFHHIMAAFLKEGDDPYLLGLIQINGKPVMFGEFRENLKYLQKHISANGISFLIYKPTT